MAKEKYAELDHQQLQDIKQLEEKLSMILIAYDESVANRDFQKEGHSSVAEINPS